MLNSIATILRTIWPWLHRQSQGIFANVTGTASVPLSWQINYFSGIWYNLKENTVFLFLKLAQISSLWKYLFILYHSSLCLPFEKGSVHEQNQFRKHQGRNAWKLYGLIRVWYVSLSGNLSLHVFSFYLAVNGLCSFTDISHISHQQGSVKRWLNLYSSQKAIN